MNRLMQQQALKKKHIRFPFVQIGSQYWTTKNFDGTVTPMVTTIKEMQANANVEKITNIADREFSSDTGFWSKGTGITIADGVCHYNSPQAYVSTLNKGGLYVAGKHYKIRFTIKNYTSGTLQLSGGGNTNSISRIANGNYIEYFTCTATGGITFYAISSNTILDIDDISIEEIGWSGSQELYDGIYAQTTGTVEQKTYAAVKAAAMWCNYNNDAAIGAVYGKLYNWFAVKLLQMDIDYYNTANSATPWGWRVPTQTDFTTLSTYLGGNAVSGGKLKMTGTTYWSSPNTGADNSSGFSALGSGVREVNGTVAQSKNYTSFWSLDSDTNTNSNRYELGYLNTLFVSASLQKIRGYSLRLIKS